MYLSVVIEALQDVPSPVPVFGVLGKSIHIEQTLHCFWSQQVVSVCRLEDKGLYQYSNDLKGITKDLLLLSVHPIETASPVSPGTVTSMNREYKVYYSIYTCFYSFFRAL